ncbi:MAG: hypothetical protein ABI255_06420 [Microbacteriaceae bacterium]
MREELIRRHPGGVCARTGERFSSDSRPSLSRGFAGDSTGGVCHSASWLADAVERLPEIAAPKSIPADAGGEGVSDVEGAVLELRRQRVWPFHASMMAGPSGRSAFSTGWNG